MSAKIAPFKISSWYRTERGRWYAPSSHTVRTHPWDRANAFWELALRSGMRGRAGLQHCDGVLQSARLPSLEASK